MAFSYVGVDNMPSWRNDPLPLMFLCQNDEDRGHGHSGIQVLDDSGKAKKEVKLYESDGTMVLGK